jgi:hypothetical protein
MVAAQSCTISCCLADQCGVRRAVTTPADASTECMARAVADTRCPSEMVGDTMRDGCCTMDNQCGLISPRSLGCTPRDRVRSGGGMMGGGMFAAQACQ